MPPDRYYVRVSPEQRASLERMARVGGVPVAALLRETTLGYGPVWVANRAADRVAGRPLKRVRARNGGA
jgi:hypothetical protein